jgi:hypothetical protein
VPNVSWSQWGEAECVRLTGWENTAAVRVRPCPAVDVDGLPPMSGRLVRDGDDVCFVPRFAFVEGTTYLVEVGGDVVAVLVRPRPNHSTTTEVLGIYPTASEVPRNLLRFYVWFSAPMSEGEAAEHVRLVDHAGDEMVGALFPTDHELWDRERRRLTILLDPARIKRGLVGHRQSGYPLSPGMSCRLEVDGAFRDARGVALRTPAHRRYRVGGEERRRVEPENWVLTTPARGSLDPFGLEFDRPLDHGLLSRCLHVVGPGGRTVDGTRTIGPEERSWRLTPHEPWTPESHQLVVDPVLEDLAGNSVSRVFDRDLHRPEEASREARAITVAFAPR